MDDLESRGIDAFAFKALTDLSLLILAALVALHVRGESRTEDILAVHWRNLAIDRGK
jgi:hypothetical protein